MTGSTDYPSLSQEKKTDILIAIFLIGGFLLSIATKTLSFASNVIWADFLHYNPNRTYAQTIQTLHESLPAAIFWTIFDMPFALIAGAIVAVKCYKKLGCLPLSYLLVMLPVCALALCVQGRIEGFLWGENTWQYIVENLTPVFLSYLLAYWWLNHKISNLP